MVRAFISIGSNIERERHIQVGIDALYNSFGDLMLSPIYESESVGFEGENFYNLVVGFETDLAPEDLVRCLHEIESEYDRRRDANRFSPRTLDLDLLLYGDLVLQTDNIRLPRKEITEYAFVLQPLADIVGNQFHPILEKPYKQLWHEFDKTRQTLWQVTSYKLEPRSIPC